MKSSRIMRPLPVRPNEFVQSTRAAAGATPGVARNSAVARTTDSFDRTVPLPGRDLSNALRSARRPPYQPLPFPVDPSL